MHIASNNPTLEVCIERVTGIGAWSGGFLRKMLFSSCRAMQRKIESLKWMVAGGDVR